MKKDIYSFSRICYIIEETTAYLITILISGAYLAKLTLYLGFSDSLTAILGSFVNLGCIFQLLAISLFKNGRVKRKATILYIINELLFTLLYVVPFIKISPNIRTGLFIAFLLGGYFVFNMVSSPRTNWFMALVPDEKRGSFTAFKEAISLVSGIVFSFTMGLFIDKLDAAGNVEASFILCGLTIFGMTVIHTLSLIFAKEKEPQKTKTLSFFQTTKTLLSDKNIVSVTLLGIIWNMCNYIAFPFLGTYQVKELSFSMTFVGILSGVYAVARIIASVFLGSYADRHSFAKMLRICYVFLSLAFLATSLAVPSNGRVMFVIHQIFYAVAMGGINSAEINLVYDYVEEEKRKDALAIRYAVCGLCGFGATLVATPILNFIQKNPIYIMDIQIYAQQVLSFISFILGIVLILYVTKLIKRNN